MVEPTACLLWDGEKSSESHHRQIRRTLRYLVGKAKIVPETEGILATRDGQIEAKGTRVDWNPFISPLQNLLFSLVTEHREEILNSIHAVAKTLYDDRQFDRSAALWQRGLEIAPDDSAFLNGLGISLMQLKKHGNYFGNVRLG